MMRRFLVCALKAYETSFFAHHITNSCDLANKATLSKRNFKTGAATKEFNTPLERLLLELCSELLLNSEESSILPLGGAKHSTLLF